MVKMFIKTYDTKTKEIIKAKNPPGISERIQKALKYASFLKDDVCILAGF